MAPSGLVVQALILSVIDSALGNGDFLLASREMRNANMVCVSFCLFINSENGFTFVHPSAQWLISFFFLPPSVGSEVAFKAGTHNGEYAKPLIKSVFLPMGSACNIHIFSALPGGQINAPSLLFHFGSGLTVCHTSH